MLNRLKWNEFEGLVNFLSCMDYPNLCFKIALPEGTVVPLTKSGMPYKNVFDG